MRMRCVTSREQAEETAADASTLQDEAMEMAGPSKAAAKTGKNKSASETYVKVRSRPSLERDGPRS